MERRVVVTGIGLVTPLGTGTHKTWNNICDGRSGIRRIQKFDPSNLKTQFAGEIPDFSPLSFMDGKEIKRTDPFIQYAVAATKMALEDAGLEVSEEFSSRVGAIIGTGVGGVDVFQKNLIEMHERGPNKVSPFFIPSIIANMASAYVSIIFNLQGPNSCVVTACAAGSHAIGDGMRVIERDEADVMIVGGAEAAIHPIGIAGFNALRALSTRNDAPERASRPFDRDRDGFVMGEGSGVLILEELGFAKRRGARIYAEIIGYGMSGDAYHITAPSLKGPVTCMRHALKNAKISPCQVDYINAHGTSTPQNDPNETRAIKEVFGEEAYKIPVSSTKSMTGHLLGATGGVEAAFTALSIYDGIIPPTINLENPDPECDLDYVANISRKARVRMAISNSFGFGGTNVALIFKAYE
jgi:3-oxoacyl-[acyl-carrier-protein] synthase II